MKRVAHFVLPLALVSGIFWLGPTPALSSTKRVFSNQNLDRGCEAAVARFNPCAPLGERMALASPGAHKSCQPGTAGGCLWRIGRRSGDGTTIIILPNGTVYRFGPPPHPPRFGPGIGRSDPYGERRDKPRLYLERVNPGRGWDSRYRDRGWDRNSYWDLQRRDREDRRRFWGYRNRDR